MNCNKCNKPCIKNGFQVNGKQRFLCKDCGCHQQSQYNYNAYKPNTNTQIVKLLANSCGIRDISRILSISKTTVLKRILRISKELKQPSIYENNQIYEADEVSIKMKGFNRYAISYIINRKTKRVIDFCIGSKTAENLKPMINKVLYLNPKRIYTDKMRTYFSLISNEIHSTKKYQTNSIERFHLTIRTHLKRCSRKTICTSKSDKILNAILKIYFYVFNTNYFSKTKDFSLHLTCC